METPEQRAERIFKEDDEKKERDDMQEMLLRQQKRRAVVVKHGEALCAMISGKQKGMAFRKYFHGFVMMTVLLSSFATEEQEYNHIGKAGRKKWSSYEHHIRTFNELELEIARDIVNEFGACDY